MSTCRFRAQTPAALSLKASLVLSSLTGSGCHPISSTHSPLGHMRGEYFSDHSRSGGAISFAVTNEKREGETCVIGRGRYNSQCEILSCSLPCTMNPPCSRWSRRSSGPLHEDDVAQSPGMGEDEPLVFKSAHFS